MGKKVKVSIFLTLSFFAIIGCSSDNEKVNMPDCGKGAFCYKGFNFGPSQGAKFEKGVRDGCKTAEGWFRKDYSLSSRSAEYKNGWMLGRMKCKQVLPNEGTRQEEINSRKRAEYQIQQMKLQQSMKESNSEEGILDTLLNTNSNNSSEDVEY